MNEQTLLDHNRSKLHKRRYTILIAVSLILRVTLSYLFVMQNMSIRYDCDLPRGARRLKDVAQKQYNQAEADAAAGKSKEVLPPAHPTASMEA